MVTTSERILTTHAGSLPRPVELVALLARQSRGEAVDSEVLEELTDVAVAEAIRLQRDAGIDVGNDGEQGRESFFTYVQHRMTGFGEGAPATRIWEDVEDFPGFAAVRASHHGPGEQVSLRNPPVAVDHVAYGETETIDHECERLTKQLSSGPFPEAFMSSPSPGIIAAAMGNTFYESIDEYLRALSSALAVEYRRIVQSGFILQIDAPDLAMESHALFANRPQREFLAFAERVIESINMAIGDLDPTRIRLHVCWGNYGGPHTHDIALAVLLPMLYQANVGGLVISGANPRHEHEYKDFERNPLPAGWTLATGVIDTTTNYVEHPEVVADRLERVVSAVGDPARVLACTDCGFDSAAGLGGVAADVAWAKLRSMREGADLASERVF
jgi:5-methyltetrahydropteroyltriglutamate--homocysteine methyltransferase